MPQKRGAPRHVLVAENEALIGLLIRDVLAAAGYDVALASDGDEALRLARQRRPDVAVLNWKMPGTAGTALLRGLRDLWPGLPVVVVTGYQLAPADLRDVGEGPPLIIMSKPVDVAGLVSAVHVFARRPRRPPK
jgi:DNA-binding response OmpR family regulator